MTLIKLLTDNGKAFVRALGGLVLLAYVYRIIKAVVTETKMNFDQQDWTILSGCLGLWVAYEAIVAIYKGWVERRAK